MPAQHRGRVAMSDEEKRARGARVRVLRDKLDLSQDDVAAASGGVFDRSKVSAVESGKNVMTTALMQESLAKGLGVRREDFGPYIAGELSVDEVIRRMSLTSHEFVPSRRSETLERVIAAAKPGEFSVAAIAAARAMYNANRQDLTERQWRDFMLDAMRHEKLASKATIDDEHDPGEALAAAKRKRARRV